MHALHTDPVQWPYASICGSLDILTLHKAANEKANVTKSQNRGAQSSSVSDHVVYGDPPLTEWVNRKWGLEQEKGTANILSGLRVPRAGAESWSPGPGRSQSLPQATRPCHRRQRTGTQREQQALLSVPSAVCLQNSRATSPPWDTEVPGGAAGAPTAATAMSFHVEPLPMEAASCRPCHWITDSKS